MKRIAAALMVSVCASALAGCGGETSELPTANRAGLHAEIESVRTAVQDDRTAAALKAVAGLRASVGKLAEQGTLNGADAKVLLIQVDRLAAKLATRSSSGPTAAPTVAATSAAPVEPKAKGAKDRGPKAKGNGKK